MSKYTDIDVKTLTVDDALRDTDWNKQPMDYVRYVTIEMPILQSIAEDFTSEETQRFMQVLALYFINGLEPDYRTIKSTAVKQAVRITITAQTERIESVYLTHYKQYVSAIQRREKQEANKGS
jgi:hypothetical protein